jgi:glyoxylate/hydroxypyruvate reductase
MKLTVCLSGIEAAPWFEGFRAALPEATVTDWLSGAKDGAKDSADYAFVWSPPTDFFATQPALKAVFNAGAGVNAILALDSLPAALPVVRLEDAGMAEQMADYVCHAVLRHFRDFEHYDAARTAGQWRRLRPPRRADFPIGVLGLGALGSHVARRLADFGFSVGGWSQSKKHLAGVTGYAGAAELDAFLCATRILVCLLPLTPETDSLINAELLAKLKPKAYLINVARGAHVVDADLLSAIASGQVAGATLDVFRVEPLPAEHGFWKEPKIHITPHISAVTLREETIAQVVHKIRQIESGTPAHLVSGVVNRERGY